MVQPPENLLKVSDLSVWFPVRSGVLRRQTGHLRAVDEISFGIRQGQTLGLVGESGCGKTTTGRAVLRLQRATSGTVIFDGQDIFSLSGRNMKRLRPRMQIVFQDPYSSLNPRMTVGASIAEGLRAQNPSSSKERENEIPRLLSLVGLSADMGRRQPHELSGGQRQRVVIARALATRPDFIVCDEAVSALDVSVRAQIVNLLQDLQEQLALTYLFISHDLSIVEHVSDWVAVMYLGKIVEMARAVDLYKHPNHPYTRALLSAIPNPDPRQTMTRVVLRGEIPSPLHVPSGCRFRTRCPLAFERCSVDEPQLRPVANGGQVACHLVDAPNARRPASPNDVNSPPAALQSDPKGTVPRG
jgi:oligopeptide transport system ATP-binding protein